MIGDNIKITPLLDTLRLQKISDAVYFSSSYSDYISNSRLNLINPEKDGSPEKFFKGLKANKIYSSALSLGSQVHQVVLQPDEFELPPDLQKPTAKVGLAADVLFDIAEDPANPTKEEFLKAYKEVDYFKGNPSEKQHEENYPKIMTYINNRIKFESQQREKTCSPYLDSRDLKRATLCVQALQNNKKIQKLLHPTGLLKDPISECEQAILLDCEVKVPDFEPFTIKLKSKLDHYSIDTENNIITVNDIKTHGKILPKFPESINMFSYYRELSMYSWLLKLCSEKFYGLKNPKVTGNFLVVSTIPPYYTQVFPFTREMLNKGWAEFLKLLRLVCYYKSYPELWNT